MHKPRLAARIRLATLAQEVDLVLPDPSVLLDEVIAGAGLADLPPKFRDTLANSLIDELDAKLVAHAEEALTNDQNQELEGILDSVEEWSDIDRWLSDHLPGYEAFMMRTLRTMAMRLSAVRSELRTLSRGTEDD